MIDVTGQISAVRRQLGSRVLEAGEARVATISQSYDTSVADLWDACTNPERLPRWFLPVSGDLRVGGRYQLEGNAGGVIERCEPPHGFAATWEFAGQVSWIEVRLTEEPDGRTRFALEHVAHVNDHWKRYGPGAVGIGWDLSVMALALHLGSGGAAVDPKEVEAWYTTEDGMRFMALSNDGWYEADVAAGADPVLARTAADRTLAFYTGAPEPE